MVALFWRTGFYPDFSFMYFDHLKESDPNTSIVYTTIKKLHVVIIYSDSGLTAAYVVILSEPLGIFPN
jgi:hypothetical protein